MSSAVSDILTTVTIRGSWGNFTLNLIKVKRHRRERVREEISSGRKKNRPNSALPPLFQVAGTVQTCIMHQCAHSSLL